MLQRGGYEIKILNTINFKQSMRYNPFKYIYCENDILKLVNCIMENTKGEDSKGGEDFWSKAEALYYQALIAYIWYEAPEEEKNMTTLLEMLNASEVREDDENFKNAVDLMFEQLESRDPDHFAVRQYKKYKMAAGVNVPALKCRQSEGGKSRNKLKSAYMHYGSYRFLGYGRLKSLYYMLFYTLNGFLKYLG